MPSEQNAIDMTGPTPWRVRFLGEDGETIGDYPFLGWMMAVRLEPVVLYDGNAHPAHRLKSMVEARSYTLLFLRGDID